MCEENNVITAPAAWPECAADVDCPLPLAPPADMEYSNFDPAVPDDHSYAVQVGYKCSNVLHWTTLKTDAADKAEVRFHTCEWNTTWTGDITLYECIRE